MKHELTETEFKDWQEHPGTKALFALLTQWQEEVKDRLASGEFLSMSQDSLVYQAKLVGSHEVCDSIRGMSYAFIQGELANESEYVGA